MPELPEVETIRRGLHTTIVGVPIAEVEVRLPKIVRGTPEDLSQALVKNQVSEIGRRGKLLILWLGKKEKAILIHLKMTGQLIYRQNDQQVAGGHSWPSFDDELPNKYTHAIIRFEDGGVLYFNDLRRFGYLQLTPANEVSQTVARYGLEPGLPEFTEAAFERTLGQRKGKVKAVLLDQTIFSGLGNIYVDESCFWAGILPMRTVESLTPDERHRLYQAINQVIGKAIEYRGTTVHDFVDATGQRGNYSDHLMVYGKAGQTCGRCGGTIERIKFSGRGTHFCPECQH